jgi:hypothetical protein
MKEKALNKADEAWPQHVTPMQQNLGCIFAPEAA